MLEMYDFYIIISTSKLKHFFQNKASRYDDISILIDFYYKLPSRMVSIKTYDNLSCLMNSLTMLKEWGGDIWRSW